MKPAAKAAALVLVAAALGYVGIRVDRILQERKRAATPESRRRSAPRVAVHKVGTATVNRIVPVTGEIEALAEVEVVPRVGGRLQRLRLPGGMLVEEGTVVRKGQLIAVIEHGALDAAVGQAKAGLLQARVNARPEVVSARIREAAAAAAAARAQLSELEARLRNLEREKDRMVKLAEEGSATEQMRDGAVTACEAAAEGRKALKAQIDRSEAGVVLAKAMTKDLADAGVAQAEAALKLARVTLDDAAIEAPISGVVSRRLVDEGDMVGPAGPIVTIVRIDRVKVVGWVSERLVSSLRPGKTPARIDVDAYADRGFGGVLRKVGVAVDPQTRTVKVEVEADNPGRELKPGMFARLSLFLDRKENVTVVPDEALLRSGSEVHVYVVNDSRAHRRALRLGLTEGDRHEVVEGLAPGDLVIVRGQHLVGDGDAVEIAEEGRR